MKFDVEITRISYARYTVRVERDSPEKAQQVALEQAPEQDFSTYETEYEVASVNAAT